MSPPNAARATALDPVALAVASALEDERPASDEELEALREAREDRRALVAGSVVTTEIAERARRDG